MDICFRDSPFVNSTEDEGRSSRGIIRSPDFTAATQRVIKVLSLAPTVSDDDVRYFSKVIPMWGLSIELNFNEICMNELSKI